MEDIRIGQVVYGWINGERCDLIVVDIREPNTLANWTSADQSRRVFKVKRNQGLARVSSKYFVRQAHQLSTTLLGD